MNVKITLNIRRIMDKKGLTPQDIEPYMPVSARTIYRTISAKRNPTLLEIVYYAKVLDVPLEELFEVEWLNQTTNRANLDKLSPKCLQSAKNTDKMKTSKEQARRS